MQRLYSTFPGGTPGIGLLILRSAAGLATGVCGGILISRLETVADSRFSHAIHIILSGLLIAGSVFFILGLMMPFVSIAVAFCELTAAVVRLTLVNPPNESRFDWIPLLLVASISVALAFLGPGAFSIDARLFGRRRIIIPASKKENRE